MQKLFENFRRFINEADDPDSDSDDAAELRNMAADLEQAEPQQDPNIQKIEDVVYGLPNVTRQNFKLDIQHDPEYSPGEYQVFQSEYAMDKLASIAGLRMSHEITSMFKKKGFEVSETTSAKEPVVLIDPKEPR